MGASVSIMSEGTHQSIWPLDVSDIKLQTYSKEPLPVVGVKMFVLHMRAREH